jgi:uncharacterized protein with HEPN domain
LWRERVADILDAIKAIQSHISGLTEDEFCASRLVVDAVERNFAVIGEAANAIPEELRARHPEVPWSLMRRMRNVLVHVFFGVSPHIVWETARNDLAPTAVLLEAMLSDEPQDDDDATLGTSPTPQSPAS